jgi:lactate permease
MLIDWLFAFSPILLILGLMIFLRWGAAKAGPAGWFAAVTVAVVRFGARLDLLAASQARAMLLALDVLMIVWAAFLLYRVAEEAGAVKVLGEALPSLTADRGMQALLIGWAFASFLQGVGGFGVPVVVTAPLLVGIGFEPLAAVIVPSLGHAWSVTFGSLASSFQALIASTGLAGDGLAPASALLLGITCFGCGYMALHAADGWGGVKRLALPVLVMGAAMAASQYALATSGLWNLAGFGGGLAGLMVGFMAARNHRGDPAKNGRAVDGKQVLLALSGYIALIGITLVIQLVPAVKAFMGQTVLELPFPALTTARGFVTPAGMGPRIILFRHAGAILTYSSISAFLIYRKAGWLKRGSASRILTGTLRGVMQSSLGIASMVAMAVVMSHAGMTDALARGMAESAGKFFPLVSPWIGALGAFVTGSNTNSNVLFAMLQLRTAELLGMTVPIILAGQTTGGAVGSVMAPTKVVVGISAAGATEDEGRVISGLLRYNGLLIAAISVVLLIWIMLAGG